MRTTILLEIDLEKDVPNLLAHIENRASTISGVRLAEGIVLNATAGDLSKALDDAARWRRMHAALAEIA